MGPNLTRLFEYKQLTGLQQELKACATYVKRKQIFEIHGEALIAALEEAPDFGGSPQTAFGYEYREWLAGVRTLLAQLESEAQP
jgi:hypothetical protein